jgi:anti-anti-sigma factor
MNYELIEIGRYKTLIIMERLDFYNVSEFKKIFFDLVDSKETDIAIELKGNGTEMSSSIISVLLTGKKKMSALKRKLVLINISEQVKSIFFLAGLTNIFTLVDNIDQLK